MWKEGGYGKPSPSVASAQRVARHDSGGSFPSLLSLSCSGYSSANYGYTTEMGGCQSSGGSVPSSVYRFSWSSKNRYFDLDNWIQLPCNHFLLVVSVVEVKDSAFLIIDS
jgi:hypothetical protein